MSPMIAANASPASLPVWPFDDLVREGLSLIPAHAPEWTNHNASDPGITLVELLAYFTELLVYRLGRVTPQAKLQFLRLLEGSEWTGWERFTDPTGAVDRQAIDRALARTLDAMSRSECVVTSGDFERAAVEAAQARLGPDQPVRAVCLAGATLERRLRGARRGDVRAHVGVVLLPGALLAPGPMAHLCSEVQQDLSARCLLATTVHVFEPTVLHVAVGFRLTLQTGVRAQTVLDAVAERLGRHGEQQGAALRVTDIIELIDTTDGVDHVEDVALLALSSDADRLGDARSGIGVQIAIRSTPGVDARLGVVSRLDPARLRRDDGGRLAAIELQPWELVRVHLARSAIEVVETGVGPPGVSA